MNEEVDHLNPDSEQQLFEKLSMSEEDLELLNYIRKDVKIQIKLRYGIQKSNSNKN